jgi:RNA polymerase-binding transcription factor DksA
VVLRVGLSRRGLAGRPPAEIWEMEKRSLQSEREATRRHYEALSEGSADLAQVPRDSQSLDLVREDGLRQAGSLALDARLRQIDEALHRIRTGRFGLCTSCGLEISRARLEEDLATQYCQVCQSESESNS